MNRVIRYTAVAALAVAIAGCAAGKVGSSRPSYSEITGTWTGPAYAEGDDVPVNVTMVLAADDGILSGHVTVPEQMMNRVPLNNLKYEEGILTCTVNMVDETGYEVQLIVRLSLEEGVFKGTFDSEDVYGVMTLRKKTG